MNYERIASFRHGSCRRPRHPHAAVDRYNRQTIAETWRPNAARPRSGPPRGSGSGNGRRQRSLAGVILASVIFCACITPWLVRNYQAFGQFIFIRDNFGAELRMGNGPGADGTWMEYLHPTQDVYAMRQYSAMGELAYVSMRKQQALDFIQASYPRFAGLCLKRFIYYWAGPPKATQPWWLNDAKNSLFLVSSVLMFWGLGRALRRGNSGAGLFFWLILLYPAIYYIVFPSPRYRVPIEPEMTILCVFLLTEVSIKAKVSLQGQPLPGE